MKGYGGRARIGNRRGRCSTCNNFAQSVMRNTRKQLIELHAEEYMNLRLKAELEVYPEVLKTFISLHPVTARKEDLGE